MKRTLSLVVSIALLCSLCGCTSSVNKETTVPLETVPATEASASGQKLQLTVEPTGEIGFTRVPAEQLGKEKVDLAYARLSGVNITLGGKTEPLADAIRTGKITGAEIFAYARMDAENGFCEESYSSDIGLTHFVYAYPDCALEIAYDVLESPDGRQTLINEITIWDAAEHISSSDHFYVDESSRWGYFLDREDWGLTFTVTQLSASGATVECAQSGGQQFGKLNVAGPMLSRKNPDTQDWEQVEPLDESTSADIYKAYSEITPKPENFLNMGGAKELTYDLEAMFGRLTAGEYKISLKIIDCYDEADVPPLSRNFYDVQWYTVKEFTVV